MSGYGRPEDASVFLVALLGFSALLILQILPRPLETSHIGFTIGLWLSIAALPHLALAAMLSTNSPDAPAALRYPLALYGVVAGLVSIVGFMAFLWAVSEQAAWIFGVSFLVGVCILTVLLLIGLIRWIYDNWPF